VYNLFRLALYLHFTLFVVSCGAYRPIRYSGGESLTVNQSVHSNRSDSIIKKYKISLDDKLSEILIYNDKDLTKGDPESALGNMFSDLLFLPWRDSIRMVFPESPAFALFNKGGLRTMLPAGNITVGSVFELMPFENELVLVHLNANAVNLMVAGLFAVKGQPVSGMKLSGTPESYSLYIGNQKYQNGQSVVVLTSDYLANGGDKMSFFMDRIQIIPLRIKIRDRLIQVMRMMGKSGQHLNFSVDKRMDI
jgi:2',3'-cyclic-nucleotide 2'-phosphodiesterase (5'-nucleotidase family)